ncbi:unnamed protein product [Gongylonema pulchrum]|uniref:7TM_GPCR_Srx domain-containing protein n=1 Tax=Gongylonema pulchrum TaxID=637853 RepID=A0A183D272_9BILA|nr:unnamed protein product [Gongylonema pulchrum]
MLATIIDSALASARWFKAAKVPHDQWAMNFSWIDLTLTILAILNGMMMLLYKLKNFFTSKRN